MSSISFYEFHNVYGFWGKKNINKSVSFPQSGEKMIKVSHNSIGIRENEIPEKSSKKRILALGGSHTWGAAINSEDRYTNILNKLTDYEFLNFGHCSLGLDQINIFIKNESLSYQPDLIFIEQYPWSIHRILNNYVNGYIRPHYVKNKQGIIFKKISYFHNFKLFRKITGNYLAFKKDFNEFSNDIVIGNKSGNVDPIYKYWTQFFYEDMYEICNYIIKQINKFCIKNGIKLVFLVNAVREEVFDISLSKLINFSIPRTKLIDLLEENSINYIDLSQSMITHNKKETVMFSDGHINEVGNNLIAKEIISKL